MVQDTAVDSGHQPQNDGAVDRLTNAAALLLRARALALDSDTDAALKCVSAAIELGKLVSSDWAAAGEIAHDCGDLSLALRCWETLAPLEPWEAAWLVKQAELAVERTDYDLAYRIFEIAKMRWPNHPAVQGHSVWYGAQLGRSNSLVYEAEVLAADENTESYPALYAAMYLAGVGKITSARRVLNRLVQDDRHPDIRDTAEIELRALDILEAAGPELSSLVPGFLGRGSNVVFQRCRGETAFVVFTGLAGRVGISVNAFHAILAPLGINAIYLYDEERLLHMNGNVALGRGYEATLFALRKTLDAWKTHRIVCVGNSAGGYAAIRYGIDLGAERVLGFGAPTTLERDFIWRMGRSRAVIKRMERYIPDAMIDLRAFLEGNPNVPRIDLYCGADMESDRIYADRLADLPNVSVHHVLDYDQHGILGELLRNGKLAPILQEACQASASGPMDLLHAAARFG